MFSGEATDVLKMFHPPYDTISKRSLCLYFSTNMSEICQNSRKPEDAKKGPTKAFMYGTPPPKLNRDSLFDKIKKDELNYTGCRLITSYSIGYTFDKDYWKSLEKFENQFNQYFIDNDMALEIILGISEDCDIFESEVSVNEYSGRGGNRFEDGYVLAIPINEQSLTQIVHLL